MTTPPKDASTEREGTVLDTTAPIESPEKEPELKLGDGGAPPPHPPRTGGGDNLPPALISDIDHTIAFPTREEFMDFSKCDSDVPNQIAIGVIKAWYAQAEKPTIYFVTNRAAGWRDDTVRWLIRFFPPGDYKWVLRMRPSNDFFSSPASIKEGFLVDEISKKHSVEQVWEDDDECILMYKTHGLLVQDAKETYC